MKRLAILFVLVLPLTIKGNVLAGERTVKFTVDNLSCVAFAYEARKAIVAVPGVGHVEVHVASATALVTFDDAQTTPDAIAAASTKAGFPARLARQDGG